ncbi:hypothetical protein NDU88_004171 [Pleurodeles waltl]|uniref:Uncharacterized protein n=1 Tax=Pleurodeles waltl TaxID=8319 RepID=A0AAV7V293_PLEWA|nr:hypothetical protein NDU88_004171 [Pleurodeles waltl]
MEWLCLHKIAVGTFSAASEINIFFDEAPSARFSHAAPGAEGFVMGDLEMMSPSRSGGTQRVSQPVGNRLLKPTGTIER